jgi:hypothetical protein
VAKRAIAIANAIAYGIANTYAYANSYANANAFLDAKVNDIALVKILAHENVTAITDPDAVAVYANANLLSSVNDIAIANAIHYAHVLEERKIFEDVNFTKLIARLEALKARMSNKKQPLEEHQAFAKRIGQIWLDVLNLSPELINLSEQEAKALEKYFYANYLMMQCNEAAVRVSPKTWEAIEERMLLVPNNSNS